jgi:hypothetical protein
MGCKHEVLKPGGYVECSLEVPSVACIASKEHLQRESCDCYDGKAEEGD